MLYSVSALWLAFLLDGLLGDPRRLPHPVRVIGRLITFLEARLRALLPKSKGGERAGGVLLALLTAACAGLFAWLLPWATGRLLGRGAAYATEVVLYYYLLAARSLMDESMPVAQALEEGDLAAARKSLSMIVGRDTAHLSPIQIARAAVETVAENTSDGVTAPMFWIIAGGPVAGYIYKAINTLDSMVGYKNERYQHFGRFSAQLDDLLNWIPSRLTAILMVAAASFCGMDGRGAWRIWRRDRRAHASPNSAQTEAACAGALGLQLGGEATYGSVVQHKPTIGEDIRPPTARDIGLANQLMYTTAILALTVFSAVRLLIVFVL